MLKRIRIYIREMFPLEVYLPYATMFYFGLFFAAQAISQAESLRITWVGVIGWFTALGILLLLRILDEFKDAETDRKLFPDRPLPRGSVKYQDIKVLGTFVLAVIVGINLLEIRLVIPFGLMLGYVWLSYKWFFWKKVISRNLILALITHQPLALAVNLYVVSTGLYLMNVSYLSNESLLAVLAFFFPITAWETSRKIRAIGKETAYVTYSKLFGPRKATLLPLVSLLTSIGLFSILGIHLKFSPIYFGGLAVLVTGVLFVHLRFMLKPSVSNLKLKPVTEFTGITLNLIFIIQAITRFGISWA